MMSAAVFAQWCQQRGLEPATQAYLARLRAAPPVRRVQGRAQNVSGTYASRKMGMTIQFESHTVELWAIYAMEYDTQVVEYFDQPDTLTLTYQSLAGRTVVVSHTPDFLVLRQDGQCTRELWSYHLGTRHISNSSSVRQRSVNPSSIAGEYFLYLTSKRLACGLIHCRNAWFASTKL